MEASTVTLASPAVPSTDKSSKRLPAIAHDEQKRKEQPPPERVLRLPRFFNKVTASSSSSSFFFFQNAYDRLFTWFGEGEGMKARESAC